MFNRNKVLLQISSYGNLSWSLRNTKEYCGEWYALTRNDDFVRLLPYGEVDGNSAYKAWRPASKRLKEFYNSGNAPIFIKRK